MTDDELLRVYLVAWNETTMNVQDRDAYALRAVFEAGARAQRDMHAAAFTLPPEHPWHGANAAILAAPLAKAGKGEG